MPRLLVVVVMELGIDKDADASGPGLAGAPRRPTKARMPALKTGTATTQDDGGGQVCRCGLGRQC